MSELEYIEKMIEITQNRIDKAEYDIKHYVKELNMFLSLKRAVVETKPINQYKLDRKIENEEIILLKI